MSSPRPSESLTQSAVVTFPEYDAPPAEPITVLRRWLAEADRVGVREARAMTLATTDPESGPTQRTVVMSELTDHGPVFASHRTSRKAQHFAADPRVAGALYWRETAQQVLLSGRIHELSDDDSDRLWRRRPPVTHAMTIASQQSEQLDDVEALRSEARVLEAGAPHPRPARYQGYELRIERAEFWGNGTERLHERLEYRRDDAGRWTWRRLHP